MKKEGFEVREFSSVEEYLSKAAGSIANKWYFYKPHLSKCGEMGQAQLALLRDQVSFRTEWASELPEKTCFFQTLPRDKEHPIIPLSFDATPMNHWDAVAANAYFLDIVVLGLLFGKIGQGLQAPVALANAEADEQPNPAFALGGDVSQLPSFINFLDLSQAGHERNPERARAGGPVPIKDGIVVDHVGVSPAESSATCWERLRMVRTILGWSKQVGSEGIYTTKRAPNHVKGLMALPGFDYKTVSIMELKVLASVAPGCTVNCIAGSKVVAKYKLQVPERIYNLPIVSCKNDLCVSNPQNKQRDVVAFMERVPYYETSVLPNCKATEFLYVCRYCRWPHVYENIFCQL